MFTVFLNISKSCFVWGRIDERWIFLFRQTEISLSACCVIQMCWWVQTIGTHSVRGWNSGWGGWRDLRPRQRGRVRRGQTGGPNGARSRRDVLGGIGTSRPKLGVPVVGRWRWTMRRGMWVHHGTLWRWHVDCWGRCCRVIVNITVEQMGVGVGVGVACLLPVNLDGRTPFRGGSYSLPK